MTNFQKLFDQADQAGKAAAAALTPVPMIVGSPSTPFGTDVDPNQKTYFVADGVCGFAWVQLPGNGPFGRWMKTKGLARKGYPKGLTYWISDYNQCMQKKEAYAFAFARALGVAGVPNVYAQSRLD